MHVLAIIVLIGLGLLFPKGMKYLIAAPLFGVALGGVAWSVAAMLLPSLITLNAFAMFLLGGVLLSEAVALFVDD